MQPTFQFIILTKLLNRHGYHYSFLWGHPDVAVFIVCPLSAVIVNCLSFFSFLPSFFPCRSHMSIPYFPLTTAHCLFLLALFRLSTNSITATSKIFHESTSSPLFTSHSFLGSASIPSASIVWLLVQASAISCWETSMSWFSLSFTVCL